MWFKVQRGRGGEAERIAGQAPLHNHAAPPDRPPKASLTKEPEPESAATSADVVCERQGAHHHQRADRSERDVVLCR